MKTFQTFWVINNNVPFSCWEWVECTTSGNNYLNSLLRYTLPMNHLYNDHQLKSKFVIQAWHPVVVQCWSNFSHVCGQLLEDGKKKNWTGISDLSRLLWLIDWTKSPFFPLSFEIQKTHLFSIMKWYFVCITNIHYTVTT